MERKPPNIDFQKSRQEATEEKPYDKQTCVPITFGWICPKCGRVLSPYTPSCPCNEKWEITF